MAELIFVLCVLAPFTLMIVLIRSRNRAQAKVAHHDEADIEIDRFATEDTYGSADGLVLGRQHLADHDVIPPDSSGGEPAGIRAMQGRR